MRHKELHIVIVGAGLAGLTAAIHLAKAQFKVTLIEKERYPIHKVCGEYISNEVLPYLQSLDLHVNTIGAVNISKLQISTQKGKMIACDLPLGGFGISRYTLDHYLWKKAQASGVKTIQDEVSGITFDNSIFQVDTISGKQFTADFVIGAYGKRSGLDYSLKRDFKIKNAPWLGVKAHYKGVITSDTVQLHNFKGGYCGISEVEERLINVCYLAHYDSFKKYKSIPKFQEAVLYQNPHLETFFENAQCVFDQPLAIAQVNFSSKNSVENHILMCGDAAGLIHPLCGNGMAMAIAGAQLAAETLIAYAKGTIQTRSALEQEYAREWQQNFASRLTTGRIVQKVLLNSTMQTTAQKLGQVLPGVVPSIIQKTHGVALQPAQVS